MIRALAASLGLLALAGCGFEPVYAPSSSASLANSGPVTIFEIEGRAGHFLRQELVRTLGRGIPGVTGSSTLEIELAESIVRLGFAPDQAASRSDYVGAARWTLRGSDGTLLANGNAREAASFNFADVSYADIAAQTAARERVAAMLARTIRDQVLHAAGEPRKPAVQPAAAPPTGQGLGSSTNPTRGPTTAKPYTVPQPTPQQ